VCKTVAEEDWRFTRQEHSRRAVVQRQEGGSGTKQGSSFDIYVSKYRSLSKQARENHSKPMSQAGHHLLIWVLTQPPIFY
jgi:hypothetical protein